MTNWKIIAIFFAGTLVMMTLLQIQGHPLIRPGTSSGIVSLELSNSKSQTAFIVNSWKSESLWHTARNNILLDFLFIPFYGFFLYSVCGYFCVQQSEPWQRAGMLLAFGSLVAMVLDVFENILMLFSLHGIISGFGTFITFLFSSLKFSLIFLALVYILLSAVFLALKKLFQK
jgi:small-conductance mechanosensitive channel